MTLAGWAPSDPTKPDRTRPRATSLDTGQQNDIGTAKALDRLHRADRAKVDLAATLRESARVTWSAGDQEGAAVLDRLVLALEDCRGGRAYREAVCGAYIVRPRSCHVRLCPDCERSRAGRLVHRISELTDTMGRSVFWTLTIPNVPRGELAGGIDTLLDAFRALRRRAIFAGGPCRDPHAHPCTHPRHRAALAAECRCAACVQCRTCIHRPVAGGVYSIEVTWRPERGDWHPHLHALMDAPWIAWAELRDAWRAVTCDAIRKAERRAQGVAGKLPRCTHPADDKGLATGGCRGASIVWVEAVAGEPGSPERLNAVRETLKYVSKGILDRDGRLVASAGAAELAELILAIRTRRLVSGWGTFRNVRDDDDDGPDPELVLTGDDVPAELHGLPIRCPQCGGVAMWEHPVDVPRRACRPGRDGWLIWRPPRPAPA